MGVEGNFLATQPNEKEKNMRFLVMVKATRDSENNVMPTRELLEAMGRFNEELEKAGVLISGWGLQPSSAGARVHFDGKSRTVIDGPFSETKELVAGFWIWECKDLAEAIEWTKRCPNPMFGPSDIEIRPFHGADAFGEEFAEEMKKAEAQLTARLGN
jgi:hypothetical protein